VRTVNSYRYPISLRIRFLVYALLFPLFPIFLLTYVAPNVSDPALEILAVWFGLAYGWLAIEFPFGWVRYVWSWFILTDAAIVKRSWGREVTLNLDTALSTTTENRYLFICSEDDLNGFHVTSKICGFAELEKRITERVPRRMSPAASSLMVLRDLRWPLLKMLLCLPLAVVYWRMMLRPDIDFFLATERLSLFLLHVFLLALFVVTFFHINFRRLARKYEKMDAEDEE